MIKNKKITIVGIIIVLFFSILVIFWLIKSDSFNLKTNLISTKENSIKVEEQKTEIHSFLIESIKDAKRHKNGKEFCQSKGLFCNSVDWYYKENSTEGNWPSLNEKGGYWRSYGCDGKGLLKSPSGSNSLALRRRLQH